MTLLLILSIWFGLGLIAELIGTIYYGEWNGIWNCLIIIAFGLGSFVAVISDIQDEEFEKKSKNCR